MNRPRRYAMSAAALALLLAPSARGADEQAAIDFFEKKVRPILVDNCYTCHSADTNAKGGLRVDDRNGLISGFSYQFVRLQNSNVTVIIAEPLAFVSVVKVKVPVLAGLV